VGEQKRVKMTPLVAMVALLLLTSVDAALRLCNVSNPHDTPFTTNFSCTYCYVGVRARDR
jgi:hypothetical protein